MADDGSQEAFQRLEFKRIESLNPDRDIVALTETGLNLLESLLASWPLQKERHSFFIGSSGLMSHANYVQVGDFCYWVRNSSRVSQTDRTLTTEIICPRTREVPEELLVKYKTFYGADPVKR